MDHSGKSRKGIVALFAAGILAACAMAPLGCAPAPTERADDLGEEAGVATVVSWSKDSDCSTCHAKESSSVENAACLASQHASLDCTFCHDDIETLKTVHNEGDMSKTSKKLKKTEVAEELCVSCHPLDDIVAATSGSEVLTDENGLTVNPHAIAPNADHDDKVYCTRCHGMHEEEDLAASAQFVCVTCHHENVYECHTCHE